MVDRGVRADHEHDLGLEHVHHRVGHGAAAHTLEQRRHRRRMAQARAVVDVVGAEAGAHQLLEQVRLLVAALGRAEAGERRRSVPVADAHQSARGQVERLVPGGLAERVAPVGGHAVEPGVLGHAVAAHQRHGEPLRAHRVVEAEPPLHAEARAVGRTVAAVGPQDAVVAHVVGELAADAAERAQRVDAFDWGVVASRIDVPRQQRTRRTRLHAFAAGHAARRAHRVVEVEHDACAVAAAGIADHVVDLLFTAGAHAPAALDAGVQTHVHRGMRAVFGRLDPRGEAGRVHAQPPGPVLQFGVGTVGDRRCVGQQQLDDHALGRARPRTVRTHRHAGCRRPAARRRKRTLAVDLDHACAAVAIRPVAVLEAQPRNLHPVPVGGLQDRLARMRLDRAAVELEAHHRVGRHTHHTTSSGK